MAEHDIRAHAGPHDIDVQRVRDRGSHPGADRHRQECAVDSVAVRQTEADIRRSTRGVDLQFGAQAVHETHDLHASAVDCADRHDERIDDDVGRGNAVIHSALDDLLGDGVAHVRILRDARLIVGNRDDRRAIFLDQRQDGLQSLVLAGHRIDQRLALVDPESGFERRDDRGIDRQRHVGDRLHELHGAREYCRLVGERYAGVDIQHVRAGLHLRPRIRFDAAEVARGHLGGEDLTARRIDALADDYEGPIEADDDLLRGGTDDRIGHDAVLLIAWSASRVGYQETRPRSTADRSMISATDSS